LVELMGTRMSFITIAVLTGIFTVIYYHLIWDNPKEIVLPQINTKLFKYLNEPKKKKISVGQVLIKTFTNKYNLPVIIMIFCQLGSYNLFAGVWGVSYIREVYGVFKYESICHYD